MMTQTCQIEAARDQAPWLMLIPLCVNYLPVEWCKLNSKQNLYPRAAILTREGVWLIYGPNIDD
jgi:hypothetical protein